MEITRLRIKWFDVFYRGELIAVVADFNKGFMAIVEDLSEVEVREGKGPQDAYRPMQHNGEKVKYLSGDATVCTPPP